MTPRTPCLSTPAPNNVRDLLDRRALLMHFQPIVSLDGSAIYAHEALVRTPPGTPWPGPDALFAAARQEDVSIELELACVRCAIRSWSRLAPPGKLFINLSASALLAGLSERDLDMTLELIGSAGVHPASLVVELTEHEHVRDVEMLVAAATRLRRNGVTVALDDFGDGRSSLRLWSELRPEIVKVDKYFTRGLPEHGDKLQTFRALLQIAETFGTDLVAEGIETEGELRVLRDLGIRYGQGYVLGRPAVQPADAPDDAAVAILRSRDVAVFPEMRRVANKGVSAEHLLIPAPALGPQATHDEVFEIFQAHPDLHAVAVVDGGRPITLINRQQFVGSFARPFFKELFGRQRVVTPDSRPPLTVDLHTGIEAMISVLTSSDQRYLAEGFVVTEGGHYRGLGTGERLVRMVTEARIEAARHANPLTFLPGNIPISNHIERLLGSGRWFAAGYADLNHFKPFNDVYGYWRGDEMIRLAARVLTEHCDPQRDFVGHVGGDDFIVLFQSENWRARCDAAVAEFDRLARQLFDPEALARGGIVTEDRHGTVRFHPCTTLCIGVVVATPERFGRAEDVASTAAAAKRQAKVRGVGVCVLEGDRVTADASSADAA